jgi:hypothetical protein
MFSLIKCPKIDKNCAKIYIKFFCVLLKMEGTHTILSDSELTLLNKEYKIIEVPSFDYYQISSKLFGNEYFDTTFNQKKVVDSMLQHQDVDLFKRTDFICNEKEKICICNNGAEDLRKLLSDHKSQKFIKWFHIKK